jgi:hypothetical protein
MFFARGNVDLTSLSSQSETTYVKIGCNWEPTATNVWTKFQTAMNKIIEDKGVLDGHLVHGRR